jgi:hypothetical protein
MAHVQSRAGYFSGTSGNLAFSSNVTAGNLIVVSIHSYQPNTYTVTDTRSNSYNLATSQEFAGDTNLKVFIYWAICASSGACTVTITPNTSGFISFGLHEYSGVAASSPLDQVNSNQGTGTAVSSGAVTTTQADELLFAAMTSMAGSQVAITPDGDYTQRLEFENGATEIHLNTQDRTVSATLTDTANWTLGSSLGWAAAVATFKLDTAPPPPEAEVDSARHAHRADSPTVTAHTPIAPADTRHVQRTDSPTLTAHTPITAADARHLHRADGATAIPHVPVAVADSRHAHTADQVSATHHTPITVNDSHHGHRADSPTPGAPVPVLIHDARHEHSADEPGAAHHTPITVHDARHGHRADSPTQGAVIKRHKRGRLIPI